jgi:glycerophosphoryl diester phosphodiesterase
LVISLKLGNKLGNNFQVALKPLIIAHRGASAIAPENTLVAFRRALADGADGVECDVRLAKDSVPVVFHDASLKRTALEDIKLCNVNSSELARTDVGTWFNLKHRFHARNDYIGETVPTLAQLFELLTSNEKVIYVELKCDLATYKRFARAVVDLIHDFRFQHRTVVKSFEHECLTEIKSLSPQIRVAALFRPHPLRVLHPRRGVIKPAQKIAADEISLHYTLATGRTLRKAHDANLPTVIWTADHPAWVKRALKLGIYGIITNNPARLLARREEILQRF